MTAREFMKSLANGTVDILQRKRQKDLADIARLTEAHPELFASLPARIKDQLA
jgi:hypothetical protein